MLLDIRPLSRTDDGDLHLDADEELRYKEGRCQIALGDYCSNSDLGPDDDVPSGLVVLNGDLYVTNQRIAFCGDECDVTIGYADIALHAFGEDSSLYPRPCVYLQLSELVQLADTFRGVLNSVGPEIPDEDESFDDSRELRFVPTRESVSPEELAVVPDVFRDHFHIDVDEDSEPVNQVDVEGLAEALTGRENADVERLDGAEPAGNEAGGETGDGNASPVSTSPAKLLFRFITAASIEYSNANPPQQLPNFQVLMGDGLEDAETDDGGDEDVDDELSD